MKEVEGRNYNKRKLPQPRNRRQSGEIPQKALTRAMIRRKVPKLPSWMKKRLRRRDRDRDNGARRRTIDRQLHRRPQRLTEDSQERRRFRLPSPKMNPTRIRTLHRRRLLQMAPPSQHRLHPRQLINNNIVVSLDRRRSRRHRRLRQPRRSSSYIEASGDPYHRRIVITILRGTAEEAETAVTGGTDLPPWIAERADLVLDLQVSE